MATSREWGAPLWTRSWNWLVVFRPTPLEKMYISQLGSLFHSQLFLGSHKIPRFQSPPTTAHLKIQKAKAPHWWTPTSSYSTGDSRAPTNLARSVPSWGCRAGPAVATGPMATPARKRRRKATQGLGRWRWRSIGVLGGYPLVICQNSYWEWPF